MRSSRPSATRPATWSWSASREVGEEQGTSLSAKAQAVEAALRQGNLPNFTVEQREVVGPAVGEELTTKGTWAMVLSLLGILGYIAFRFQFSFAVGAVVATYPRPAGHLRVPRLLPATTCR